MQCWLVAWKGLQAFKVVFDTDHCQIKDAEGKYVFEVMMKRKSFTLYSLEQKQKAYAAAKINAEVWHKRRRVFNHAAVINLRKKDLVQGLRHLEANIPNWKTCQFDRLARLPFKKATQRATEKLKIIHTKLDLKKVHHSKGVSITYFLLTTILGCAWFISSDLS